MNIFYSNTTNVSAEIECPACEQRMWASFDALIGSGQIPRTDTSCGKCGVALVINADLDISVEAV